MALFTTGPVHHRCGSFYFMYFRLSLSIIYKMCRWDPLANKNSSAKINDPPAHPALMQLNVVIFWSWLGDYVTNTTGAHRQLHFYFCSCTSIFQTPRHRSWRTVVYYFISFVIFLLAKTDRHDTLILRNVERNQFIKNIC